MRATGVDFGLSRLALTRKAAKSSNGGSTRDSTGPTNSSRLNGKRLAHDRATLAKKLQLGDGTTTWRDLCLWTSRGRQGPKSGGRCLFQERAHGLGLTKYGVHVDNNPIFLTN